MPIQAMSAHEQESCNQFLLQLVEQQIIAHTWSSALLYVPIPSAAGGF